MLELNRTKCCGLRELHGIQIARERLREGMFDWCVPTPDEIVLFVKDQFLNNARDCAFVVFAGAQVRGIKCGMALASFIKKHNLGSMATHSACRNPNSGNQLRVWIWKVNRRAVKRWKSATKK
jgi:hypothetical protein